MAITRNRRVINFNEPEKDNVYSGLSSLRDPAPSPITAPRPYYFVSDLPDTSTVSSGASVYTDRKMYCVMEGNKRITTWGYTAGYSLNGMGNPSYYHNPYPVLAQYDYPLDLDDYIVHLAVGNGHSAAFVTAKGYIYVGAYNDDDGWMGFGDNTNRFAFSRVAHADTITTASYSSGGAAGANTMVISATNTNIQVGQIVVGTGIPAWTKVTAVSGTTITFDNVFHTQAAGVYSFGLPWGPGGVRAKKIYLPSGAYNSSAERWALVLDDVGNVYSAGYNGHGALGNGTTDNRKYFSRITALSNIKEVYCHNYAAYAINYAGQMYGWGYNGYGTFGIGNTTNQLTPVLVASNVDKVFIKNHDYDTAFYITRDGNVFVAGSNYYGALGINTENTGNTTTWTALNTTNMGTRRVIDIKAAGTGTYNTTWFLCDDGTVWSCGYNGYGQIGDNTTSTRQIPTQLITPTNFPKTNKIIVGGGSTTHFITGINMESGRMWSVGSFNHGAMGQGYGDPSATWAFTSTSTRSQYPAREVLAPAAVEDGYASIKDIWPMSGANGETTVFCLLTDGTLWVRGYGATQAKGHKYTFRYSNADYMYVGSQDSDSAWKQVEF